jgi:hypothetical protein
MNEDRVLNAILITIVLFIAGIALVLVAAAFDTAQAYRAFDATAACRVQRMEAVRRPFATDVVCIPAIIRQDTTTVRLEAGR